jgi:16S rRNA (guanine966-N2)-methyltransferase
VLFVESSVEGRGLLWENIDTLGLHGRTRILRRDATDLGSVGNLEPFHLLFADPPYGQGLGEKAFAAAAGGGWLVPGALAILEERADVVVDLPPVYLFLEVRTFGDSKMHFYRYQPV